MNKEEALWADYATARGEGRTAARNRLVENYLSIVDWQADRYMRTAPKAVERDDLISAGSLGLIRAVETFDPARGIRFETYAPKRVRGAILDWARDQDPWPRLVRSRNAKVQRATEKFVAATGREPSRAELAAELGLGDKRAALVLGELMAGQTFSLSHRWFERDRGRECRTVDLVADRRSLIPVEAAAERDAWQALLRGLRRKDALLLTLMYLEGLTMEQAGRALGVSESRVSQMHSAIIRGMREALCGGAAGKSPRRRRARATWRRPSGRRPEAA